jgi:hypothetical protein
MTDPRHVLFLISPHLVHLRCLFERDAMGDDIARIYLSIFDSLEQRFHIVMHVSLAHLHRDAFAKGRPEWDLIEKPTIDFRYRQCAALADSLNGLPQNDGSIRFHQQGDFDLVICSLQLGGVCL